MFFKHNLKKIFYGSAVFIVLISAVLFIYGREIKSKLRYIYWDIAKDVHRVQTEPPKVVSFYSDSLKIVGDLFEAETSRENLPPCILLLHGSSPKGRKAAVIQILARKFQEKNYTVLAIDLRAYGDSQDPPSYTVENFDFQKDVISALNYLVKNVSIDTNRLYIIGHSGGAGASIGSINKYGKINKAKKMVLLGPPRRVQERVFDPQAKDREYFLKRWKKDMDLPYDLIYEVSKEAGKPQNIEDLVIQPNHIPLFLIDGDKEDKQDLEYLKYVYSKSKPPVDYWTIRGTGHYLDAKYINNMLFYEGRAVDKFVDRVDAWLKGSK
ncbi:MAG: alpha/beta hydrolase [Ignavibacteria bacterium]